MVTCLDCSDDTARGTFTGPAIGNAFDANLRVFGRVSDDSDRSERRGLQSPAKPRNQRLAIEFNQRLVAAKPPASAPSEHKSVNPRSPAFTGHKSPVTSHLAESAADTIPRPPPARDPAAEYRARAIFPGSFADAVRSSPLYAAHS